MVKRFVTKYLCCDPKASDSLANLSLRVQRSNLPEMHVGNVHDKRFKRAAGRAPPGPSPAMTGRAWPHVTRGGLRRCARNDRSAGGRQTLESEHYATFTNFCRLRSRSGRGWLGNKDGQDATDTSPT